MKPCAIGCGAAAVGFVGPSDIDYQFPAWGADVEVQRTGASRVGPGPAYDRAGVGRLGTRRAPGGPSAARRLRCRTTST
jgi:hypothetical protein